jgi:DNA-directed RNA polymerase subunit M/transcription elongation factor TFIIS
MKTILLTYMAFGLLANLTGPVSNKMKEDYDLNNPANRLLSDGGFMLKSHFLLRFIVFLFYPIIYLEYLYSYLKEAEIKQIAKVLNKGLLFNQMKGRGRINCVTCGYNQRVTSFMRSEKDGLVLNILGHQCQECGRFKEVNSEQLIQSTVKMPKNATLTLDIEGCECGGELSRDRVVCCPRCKSENVTYECLLLP